MKTYGLGGWGHDSFIIHDISTMYNIFVVIHPLHLILLPNENLVQMFSNDMLYDMYKCHTKKKTKKTSPTTTKITKTTIPMLAKISAKLCTHSKQWRV